MSLSASPDNSKRLCEPESGSHRSSIFKKLVIPMWLTAAVVAGVMIWYTGISNRNLEKAAATGDMAWQDRYRRTEPKLDAAIKKLIDIFSEIDSVDELANVTNSANLELVVMENKAFELTAKGNRQAALALLQSGEYEKQKTTYREAMQQLSRVAKEHIESKIKMNRFIARASMLLTGVLISLTAFAWLAVVSFLREMNTQRTTTVQLNAANQQLVATEQQLRASNQQLAAGNEELCTSQKKIEQLNKELEASVEHANLMAREAMNANEAKGRFLANLSHEIRTPMNAIVVFSDVLADEKMTEQQEDYVSLIRESSGHLLQLINSMLDFSEIEAGRIRSEMADCSLTQILNAINSLMSPAAEKKKLKFEIIPDKDLPAKIITDGSRLRQCLINLLGNAIKFTNKGSVIMKVKLHKATEKVFIRFDIEDTGIGIPVEKQRDIFECFEQVDDTPSRRHGGTGLGLAIAKQLAQLLGGELTLKSEQGNRSVFSLVIPVNLDVRKQPTLDQKAFSREMSPEDDDLLQTKFSGSVLVAEDVMTNQLLIQHLLEKMGFEVTVVEDGNKCVQKAVSRSYDLIFMDMQMPNMNGYEATRVLRGKFIDTPIIALTANAMAGDKEKCICAGCDDYLPKPIDRRLLTEKILKHIPPKASTENVDSIKLQVDELADLCRENLPGSQQSQTADSNHVINWDKLIRRLEDEEIIREVVPLFPEDNKQRINMIAEAIDSGDTKKIKSCAHAIKGAAINIGAGRLSEIAAKLEVAGHKGKSDQYPHIFDELAVEFEKVIAFISQPDWHEIAKQQTCTTEI